MKRITISRAALVAGEPCWLVDGVPMRGFECRGVVFIKAQGGRAWMEFHGDEDRFTTGGRVIVVSDAETEQALANLFPAGQRARLAADPTLAFGAVNRSRVMRGAASAVTAYTHLGGALVPAVRFEGVVRSVTVRPPVLARPEPLNAWIETNGSVEFL